MPNCLPLAVVLVLFGGTAVADAASRHMLIEPIRPDRPATAAEPAPHVCYCCTVHETNPAGRTSWTIVCTEKPMRRARRIEAPDCDRIEGLKPD